MELHPDSRVGLLKQRILDFASKLRHDIQSGRRLADAAEILRAMEQANSVDKEKLFSHLAEICEGLKPVYLGKLKRAERQLVQRKAVLDGVFR